MSHRRRLALAFALLAAPLASGAAQSRAQLEVVPPAVAGAPALVTASNLLADGELRDLVRSGFPASLRFRLELWRVGGLFNDLEGREEWEMIVQYDPTAQRYRLIRRQERRIDDLGSFATLTTAQSAIEQPQRPALQPARRGAKYYYNLTLDVTALSVSDLDQLERWLRGVKPSDPAGAIGSGVRTLMLRMLGGETRHLEKRSPQFVLDR